MKFASKTKTMRKAIVATKMRFKAELTFRNYNRKSGVDTNVIVRSQEIDKNYQY